MLFRSVSALTPYSFHHAVSKLARGIPDDAQDVWPTFYRLNSRKRIRAYAHQVGFRDIQLRMVEMEPSYLRFHPLALLVGVGYERLVNASDLFAGLRANIFGRLVKTTAN